MKTSPLAILIAAALALSHASAWAQNTPGYNQKIPEKIMTPDRVDTHFGPP